MVSDHKSFLQKATVFMAVAFVVGSCQSKLKTTSDAGLATAPVMVVDNMFVIQTDKGKMQMRVEAPVMERYHTDSLDWEQFPQGFVAYAYNEEGLLETELKAEMARHTTPASGEEETWGAFGNVCVRNLINRQTLETDTLYWDRYKERIYTDCYVRLLSPQGFMQGYGLESDQRARNSVILKPFNSYGLVGEDSTAVEIDSINFIGPFPKK